MMMVRHLVAAVGAADAGRPAGPIRRTVGLLSVVGLDVGKKALHRPQFRRHDHFLDGLTGGRHRPVPPHPLMMPEFVQGRPEKR